MQQHQLLTLLLLVITTPDIFSAAAPDRNNTCAALFDSIAKEYHSAQASKVARANAVTEYRYNILTTLTPLMCCLSGIVSDCPGALNNHDDENKTCLLHLPCEYQPLHLAHRCCKMERLFEGKNICPSKSCACRITNNDNNIDNDLKTAISRGDAALAEALENAGTLNRRSPTMVTFSLPDTAPLPTDAKRTAKEEANMVEEFLLASLDTGYDDF